MTINNAPPYARMMRDQLILADRKVELLVDAPALGLVSDHHNMHLMDDDSGAVVKQGAEIRVVPCT